jgi:DNA (cytosine-5)-methyltransferase 1
VQTVSAGLSKSAALPRKASTPTDVGNACHPALANWLKDDRLHVLLNNETRGHMRTDLARYLFAAIWAGHTSQSPKASTFPASLAPSHRSWDSGKFADRFRVQLRDQPSTTITSHISKDGHYFIHPDPSQCRSLTVREAARLQTFPDNYLFRGNRTQQYVQVGNAVPPFLAREIAGSLWDVLARVADNVCEPSEKREPITEVA